MPIECLPHLKSLEWQQVPDRAENAYRIILKAEDHATLYDHADNLISVRVVGYLFLEFLDLHDVLGDQAFSRVVQEVTSLPWKATHNQNDIVFLVGKRYQDHLI